MPLDEDRGAQRRCPVVDVERPAVGKDDRQAGGVLSVEDRGDGVDPDELFLEGLDEFHLGAGVVVHLVEFALEGQIGAV